MKMELSIYEGAFETMVLISRNSFPKTSGLGSFYLTNQISSYVGVICWSSTLICWKSEKEFDTFEQANLHLV